jgi:hypothetical protein
LIYISYIFKGRINKTLDIFLKALTCFFIFLFIFSVQAYPEDWVNIPDKYKIETLQKLLKKKYDIVLERCTEVSRKNILWINTRQICIPLEQAFR